MVSEDEIQIRIENNDLEWIKDFIESQIDPIDLQEAIIFVNDHAYISMSFDIIRYLFYTHGNDSCSHETTQHILSTYPDECIQEIKTLILELELSRL